MASLADAGMVTLGVTDLAVARAAPLAYAGMAFPADPAGMAFLADLVGDVTIEVVSLADARMAFPADIAWEATVDVTSLADAGMVTVGVTDLADVSPVDIVGVPECGGGVVSWGDRLSPGVWC